MRYRPLVALAMLTAGVAVLLLLGSGLGVQAGLWTFRTGFSMLRWGAFVGVAGAALSAIALAMARPPGRLAVALGAALLASAAAFYVPWRQLAQARVAAPIHDITTDTADPPAFVAILPLRAGASNPATYGGPDVAAAQAKAYPDIAPRRLAIAPAAAFDRALRAAREMGWRIVAADTSAGRIEATATTQWFRFKDDVVVRVRPVGTGSRIDVRSVSRVGGSDVGTNARRIRAYLAHLGS